MGRMGAAPGALALPLAVIPVLLHRGRLISSENFVIVEAAAIGLAALGRRRRVHRDRAAVGHGRPGLVARRDRARSSAASDTCRRRRISAGWPSSMPSSPDVSTDFVNPPALVNFVESRFIGPGERERIEAAYPNARPRTYPIEAPQMFGVVETLIDAQGWEVRARRAPLSAH